MGYVDSSNRGNSLHIELQALSQTFPNNFWWLSQIEIVDYKWKRISTDSLTTQDVYHPSDC